ncbi:MAG: hypothetical protein AB1439_00610 [candidate division FCPU426 bacterium]
MPKNKGTNYYFTTTKLLEKSGPSARQKFLEQLTPAERAFHEKALEISWLDAAMVSANLAKAARIIFPGRDHPLQECGRLEALDHLTGMYRIFLRFVSVEMVMKQAAKIWRQYHDAGAAYVKKTGDKRLILFVEAYPELTPELRDIVAGYCQGTIELTGAREVVIAINDKNPAQWQFEVSWK